MINQHRQLTDKSSSLSRLLTIRFHILYSERALRCTFNVIHQEIYTVQQRTQRYHTVAKEGPERCKRRERERNSSRRHLHSAMASHRSCPSDKLSIPIKGCAWLSCALSLVRLPLFVPLPWMIAILSVLCYDGERAREIEKSFHADTFCLYSFSR